MGKTIKVESMFLQVSETPAPRSDTIPCIAANGVPIRLVSPRSNAGRQKFKAATDSTKTYDYLKLGATVICYDSSFDPTTGTLSPGFFKRVTQPRQAGSSIIIAPARPVIDSPGKLKIGVIYDQLASGDSRDKAVEALLQAARRVAGSGSPYEIGNKVMLGLRYKALDTVDIPLRGISHKALVEIARDRNSNSLAKSKIADLEQVLDLVSVAPWTQGGTMVIDTMVFGYMDVPKNDRALELATQRSAYEHHVGGQKIVGYRNTVLGISGGKIVAMAPLGRKEPGLRLDGNVGRVVSSAHGRRINTFSPPDLSSAELETYQGRIARLLADSITVTSYGAVSGTPKPLEVESPDENEGLAQALQEYLGQPVEATAGVTAESPKAPTPAPTSEYPLSVEVKNDQVMVSGHPSAMAKHRARILAAGGGAPAIERPDGIIQYPLGSESMIKASLADLAGTPQLYIDSLSQNGDFAIRGRVSNHAVIESLADAVKSHNGQSAPNGTGIVFPSEAIAAVQHIVRRINSVPPSGAPERRRAPTQPVKPERSAPPKRSAPKPTRQRKPSFPSFYEWCETKFSGSPEAVADVLHEHIARIADVAEIDWDATSSAIAFPTPGAGGGISFKAGQGVVPKVRRHRGSVMIGTNSFVKTDEKQNRRVLIGVNFRNYDVEADKTWKYETSYDDLKAIYDSEKTLVQTGKAKPVQANPARAAAIDAEREQRATKARARAEQHAKEDAKSRLQWERRFAEMPKSDGQNAQLLKKGSDSVIHQLDVRQGQDPQHGRFEIIQLKDLDGNIHGAQRFFDTPIIGGDGKSRNKLVVRGTQFVWPDGRPTAAHFVVGDIDPSRAIFFAEGLHDGATINRVSQLACVACYSTTNMPHVLSAYRAKYPETRLIIAADNDIYKPSKGNPGVIAAMDAAAPNGARIVIPVFTTRSEDIPHPTDINDLATLEGDEATIAQLRKPLLLPANELSVAATKARYIGLPKLNDYIEETAKTLSETGHDPAVVTQRILADVSTIHDGEALAAALPEALAAQIPPQPDPPDQGEGVPTEEDVEAPAEGDRQSIDPDVEAANDPKEEQQLPRTADESPAATSPDQDVRIVPAQEQSPTEEEAEQDSEAASADNTEQQPLEDAITASATQESPAQTAGLQSEMFAAPESTPADEVVIEATQAPGEVVTIRSASPEERSGRRAGLFVQANTDDERIYWDVERILREKLVIRAESGSAPGTWLIAKEHEKAAKAHLRRYTGAPQLYQSRVKGLVAFKGDFGGSVDSKEITQALHQFDTSIVRKGAAIDAIVLNNAGAQKEATSKLARYLSATSISPPDSLESDILRYATLTKLKPKNVSIMTMADWDTYGVSHGKNDAMMASIAASCYQTMHRLAGQPNSEVIDLMPEVIAKFHGLKRWQKELSQTQLTRLSSVAAYASFVSETDSSTPVSELPRGPRGAIEAAALRLSLDAGEVKRFSLRALSDAGVNAIEESYQTDQIPMGTIATLGSGAVVEYQWVASDTLNLDGVEKLENHDEILRHIEEEEPTPTVLLSQEEDGTYTVETNAGVALAHLEAGSSAYAWVRRHDATGELTRDRLIVTHLGGELATATATLQFQDASDRYINRDAPLSKGERLLPESEERLAWLVSAASHASNSGISLDDFLEYWLRDQQSPYLDQGEQMLRTDIINQDLRYAKNNPGRFPKLEGARDVATVLGAIDRHEMVDRVDGLQRAFVAAIYNRNLNVYADIQRTLRNYQQDKSMIDNELSGTAGEHYWRTHGSGIKFDLKAANAEFHEITGHTVNAWFSPTNPALLERLEAFTNENSEPISPTGAAENEAPLNITSEGDAGGNRILQYETDDGPIYYGLSPAEHGEAPNVVRLSTADAHRASLQMMAGRETALSDNSDPITLIRSGNNVDDDLQFHLYEEGDGTAIILTSPIGDSSTLRVESIYDNLPDALADYDRALEGATSMRPSQTDQIEQPEQPAEAPAPDAEADASPPASALPLKEFIAVFVSRQRTYDEFLKNGCEPGGKSTSLNPYYSEETGQVPKEVLSQAARDLGHADLRETYEAEFFSEHGRRSSELPRTAGVIPSSIDPTRPLGDQFRLIARVIDPSASARPDAAALPSIAEWATSPSALLPIHRVLGEDPSECSDAYLADEYTTDELKLLADLHCINVTTQEVTVEKFEDVDEEDLLGLAGDYQISENSTDMLVKAVADHETRANIAQTIRIVARIQNQLQAGSIAALARENQDATRDILSTLGLYEGGPPKAQTARLERYLQLKEATTSTRMSAYSYVAAALVAHSDNRALPAQVVTSLQEVAGDESILRSIFEEQQVAQSLSGLFDACQREISTVIMLSAERKAELLSTLGAHTFVGDGEHDHVSPGDFIYASVDGSFNASGQQRLGSRMAVYENGALATEVPIDQATLRNAGLCPVSSTAIVSSLRSTECLLQEQGYIATMDSPQVVADTIRLDSNGYTMTRYDKENGVLESHTKQPGDALMWIAGKLNDSQLASAKEVAGTLLEATYPTIDWRQATTASAEQFDVNRLGDLLQRASRVDDLGDLVMDTEESKEAEFVQLYNGVLSALHVHGEDILRGASDVPPATLLWLDSCGPDVGVVIPNDLTKLEPSDAIVAYELFHDALRERAPGIADEMDLLKEAGEDATDAVRSGEFRNIAHFCHWHAMERIAKTGDFAAKKCLSVHYGRESISEQDSTADLSFYETLGEVLEDIKTSSPTANLAQQTLKRLGVTEEVLQSVEKALPAGSSVLLPEQPGAPWIISLAGQSNESGHELDDLSNIQAVMETVLKGMAVDRQLAQVEQGQSVYWVSKGGTLNKGTATTLQNIDPESATETVEVEMPDGSTKDVPFSTVVLQDQQLEDQIKADIKGHIGTIEALEKRLTGAAQNEREYDPLAATALLARVEQLSAIQMLIDQSRGHLNDGEDLQLNAGRYVVCDAKTGAEIGDCCESVSEAMRSARAAASTELQQEEDPETPQEQQQLGDMAVSM